MVHRAGRLHKPHGTVEDMLLTVAGRRYADDVQVRCRARRTGDAAADQRADHRDRGAERQHTIGPARRCRDPIDDVAEHAGDIGRVLDQRIRIGGGSASGRLRRIDVQLDRRAVRPAKPLGQEAKGAIEIAAERRP